MSNGIARNNEQNTSRIKKMTVIGIMGALSAILMYLEFPIPAIIPGFVKFDFSELPALITSFAIGPLGGVMVCFLKNLLHMFVTSTVGVGELSNFVLGASFVFTAGLIYKKNKSRKSALLGALLGAVIMSVISLPSNYFVMYPLYSNLFGMPMEAIISAYNDILPGTDNLLEALVIFNMPFNFVKGMVSFVITALVYKKISPLLK